jgi:hypothetical protein
MWISGPIAIVHDEHICHELPAVARIIGNKVVVIGQKQARRRGSRKPSIWRYVDMATPPEKGAMV